MYKLCEKDLYSKYGYCYIVFDCCGSGPSTKDTQHTNRSGKVLPNITLISDEKCVKSQDDFLITKKKTRFIVGVSNYLSQNGLQCVAHVDTTIAKIVLDESMLLPMLMILMFYVY